MGDGTDDEGHGTDDEGHGTDDEGHGTDDEGHDDDGDDNHITGVDVAALAEAGLIPEGDAQWYDSAVDNLDYAVAQYAGAI